LLARDVLGSGEIGRHAAYSFFGGRRLLELSTRK
jgi:hypothetical protein